MISPKFVKGKNIADLAPTTIFISPFCIASKILYFCIVVTSLCHKATILPNLLFNMEINCGVNDISGNKNIADLLLSIAV